MLMIFQKKDRVEYKIKKILINFNIILNLILFRIINKMNYIVYNNYNIIIKVANDAF